MSIEKLGATSTGRLVPLESHAPLEAGGPPGDGTPTPLGDLAQISLEAQVQAQERPQPYDYLPQVPQSLPSPTGRREVEVYHAHDIDAYQSHGMEAYHSSPVAPQQVPPPVVPQQVTPPVAPQLPALPPLPEVSIHDEPLTVDPIGPLPELTVAEEPLDLGPPEPPQITVAEEPLDLDPPSMPEVALPGDPLDLASPPGPEALGKRMQFLSLADPHLTTADGKRFDNAREGDFILAHSEQGNLMVQVRQGSIPGDRGIWQTAAALQVGSDRLKFEAATDQLTLNGQVIPFKAGQRLALAEGGYVEMSQDKLSNGTPFHRLQVHTSEGDDLYLLAFTRKDGGHYLDLRGDWAATRKKGEIAGLAGTVDGDGNPDDDLRTREGALTKDLASLAASWAVRPDENLF